MACLLLLSICLPCNGNWYNNGRKEKTSFCIIDAQSVKNADTAERKGYDAGKKISVSYRS
ncbi:MAG: hypothetical protein TV42_02125 [Wolbachia endosymbiont of Dactylopius coccus]|nr:MAG: hypothetical protein TV42_02125 [Wolbachia endosymbiont of Dactylopius coccus]